MARFSGKKACTVISLFMLASIYTYMYVTQRQPALHVIVKSETKRQAVYGNISQAALETGIETAALTRNIGVKQIKHEFAENSIDETVDKRKKESEKFAAKQMAPETNDIPIDINTENKNETETMDNAAKEKNGQNKKILHSYNPKLDPVNTNCTKDKMVVPNIVHWTWFYDKPQTVSWMAYISMLSAIRIQKAEIIYVWCTTHPVGKYWDAVLGEANKTNVDVQIRHMTPPKQIYNITITWKAHQSDIVRLEKLRDYGGIYMDLDVIILRSFEPLMCYDLTLGRERNIKVNNGIILSKKNPTFFKHWFDLYRRYDNKCYDCSNVRAAHSLALKYPHLVHIEHTTMNRPGFAENQYLYFKELGLDWSHNYCIHTWYRAHKKEYTPDSIKTLDLAIGELFRFIYYGSADMIFD